MKLVEKKADYLLHRYQYELMDNDSTKKGYVQSTRPIDCSKVFYKVEDLLLHYPVVYIEVGQTKPFISRMLLDMLQFKYDIVLEDSGGKLLKRQGFYGEPIFAWESMGQLINGTDLISALQTWDATPIGAFDAGTFEAIKQSHPDLVLTQGELRLGAYLFQPVGGQLYTFVNAGFVIDQDFNIHTGFVEGREFYFMLEDKRVPLSEILNYRINQLRL